MDSTKTFTVTFTLTKDNGARSLKTDYGGDYTQDEKIELRDFIIDTILPNGMYTVASVNLDRAWRDYLYESGRR